MIWCSIYYVIIPQKKLYITKLIVLIRASLMGVLSTKYICGYAISIRVSMLSLIHYKFYNCILSFCFFQTELLPLYPQAAAFTFNVSFFITDWGVSGVEPLLTSQYIKRTNPRFERYKNMYIPKRTQYVNTHEVQPKHGYTRYVSYNITSIYHLVD